MNSKTNNPTLLPILESEFGKLPPQALEIEEAVLGAVMIEAEAFDLVNNILTTEMFYKPAHQRIFIAFQELNREQKPIDMLTVAEKLRQKGELEAAGGHYNITLLVTQTSSAAHIGYHSEIIREKYLRREIIRASTANVALVYDDTIDTYEAIDKANADIERIMEISIGSDNSETMESAIIKSRAQMYERIAAKAKGQQSGITTGFADLNRFTNGWQSGKVIILAARPAVGKTSIAIHFAKSAAKTGNNVVFFSLEMEATELTDKMIAAQSDVSLENYTAGVLSDKEIQDIEQGLTAILKLPITIADNPKVTVDNIAAKARLLKKQGKCDMVIIDYLQLITPDRIIRNRTREQEVTEMSRLLKIHAKALQIPFIVLCQLNRDIEKRTKSDPQLSDLRESGAIEQDADMVIFIDRPELYEDVNNKPELINTLKLLIRKHRGGKLGEVKLRHNGTMNDFFDCSQQYASSQFPTAKNFYETEKEQPF